MKSKSINQQLQISNPFVRLIQKLIILAAALQMAPLPAQAQAIHRIGLPYNIFAGLFRLTDLPLNGSSDPDHGNAFLMAIQPDDGRGATGVATRLIQGAPFNGTAHTPETPQGPASTASALTTDLTNPTESILLAAIPEAETTSAFQFSPSEVTASASSFSGYGTTADNVPGFDMASPVLLAQASVPHAPANLEATPDHGRVWLTWDSPTGPIPTGYEISSDGGANFTQQLSDGSRRWTWIFGLTNGTTYSIVVRAVNDYGHGPSATVSATPISKAPNAPANLTAKPGDGQVWLAWDTITGPTATGYEISTDGGASFRSYSDDNGYPTPFNGIWINGTTPSFGFTLTNGTAYNFVVRAVNDYGHGPSSTVTATPLFSAPTNLTATAGDGDVVLHWSQATTKTNQSITGYQLKTNNGSFQTIPNSGSGGANRTSYTRTNLTNGTTYSFKVRAIHGRESTSVTAKPLFAALSGLTATAADTEVTLSWDDPGDSSISGYKLSIDGGTYSTISTSSSAGSIRHSVTGLSNGTSYSFAVRAVKGKNATAVTATPLFDAPTNLTATAADTEVSLSWDDPGDSSISGYELSIDGGAYSSISGSNATTTSHSVTGLTNGTSYSFAVRAENGKNATAVTATPLFDAPTNLTATAADTEVSLSWDDPGDSSISGYELSIDGGAYSSISGSDATTTSHTVTGLTNGTSYSFAVRAENGKNATAVTATPLFDALTNLTATAADTEVSLSWDDPDNATISGYELSIDGGTYTSISGSNATTTSHSVTGLSNGTSYSFAVRAVKGKNATAVTATPLFDALTNLTATAADTEVSLSWDDPDNATISGYELSIDGGTYTSISGSNATTTSHSVTGLTNGTSYSFAVRAVKGKNAAAVTATPLFDALTNLTATAADTEVSLSWDDPDNATISGYELSIDGGTYTSISGSNATTTSHSVTGLTNGTSYSFAVRAVKGKNATAVTATPLFDALTNLTATAADTEVSLSWDDPDNATISGYELSIDGGTYTSISGSDATTTSHSVTGLTNGTSYSFAVRAENGKNATAVTATPLFDAPTNLTATAADTKVTLSWDDPGDSSISGYELSIDGGTYTSISGSDATTTSHSVTGLTNGTSYSFAVRAENGKNATAVTATPLFDAPTNLTATAADTKVTLSWDDPGDSSISGYELSIDGGTYTSISGSDATTTSHSVTGLTNGTSYSFAVRAENGKNATAVTATPLFDAPTNLTATAADTKVTLSWDDPDNATISGYELSIDGGAYSSISGSNATTTSHSVTGLTNGTSYSFAVRAENGKNATAVTATPLFDALTNLSATAADTEVSLSWDDPGDSSISGYQLSIDGGAYSSISGSDATTTSHSVTGLTNGTSYSFAVRAENGKNATAVTAIPLFDALTNLSATAADTEVSLSWDDPGDSSISGYQLSIDGGAYSSISGSDATTTSHTVTGLTNGTSYSFAVRAVNGKNATAATATPLAALSISSSSGHSQTQNICERLDALSSNGKTCNLSSKGITSLSSDDFDSLSNLQTLYLNKNDLSNLPEDIFAGLSNLRTLYLNKNDLSSLPEDIFAGLSNLRTLYLNKNDLTSLPEDIFAGLSNLRALYLNKNNLSSLPQNIFTGLSDLDKLSLDKNDLSSLPENIFTGLSDLRVLYLNKNNLNSLPEDIFDGLSDLDTLSLNKNNLSSLPEDIFDGLSDLDTLSLNGNSLTCLPRSLSLSVMVSSADLPRCGNLLVLTPTSLTVTEAGSGSYTVALGSAPTATVTVTVSSGSGSGSGVTLDTDAATSGNQTSLSFTTANWNTPQTVEVSAGQDNDAVDNTVTLSHSASGGDYVHVTANLPVTVTDDDKAPALVLTPESLTVVEGSSSSYTVALNSAPTATVMVTVSSDSGVTMDTDAATNGNQNTLSFSAANWNTPQTVKLSIGQDDDAIDEIVALSHTASGGDYGSITANLSVTVIDDETATLIFTPSSLTLVGGGSGSYTVALASAPTAAVTVTVSAGAGVTMDTDAATNGNQNTLSFSTVNWSTPQTVEVSVGQDIDDTVTLSHSASGGDYGSVTASLSVNVQNICERLNALTFNGITTCNLSSKGITSLNPGDFDGLSNVQHLDLEYNELSSLPEDIFNGLSSLTRISLNNNNLSSLPEDIFDGLSNLLYIYLNENKLSSLPEDIFDGLSYLRMIYLNDNELSSLPEDIFDGPSYLRFLYLHNNDLSKLPEDIFDGLSDLHTIFLSGNSLICLPRSLRSLPADAWVNVKLPQCDNLLTLTPSSLTLAEGGSGSYTVALASTPTAAVTVTVSADSAITLDTDAATNGNQNTLSFSTANWNTPQTVEVSPRQDDNAIDENVTLSHTASSGDYIYVTANLSITITDDETAALLLTPSSLTVLEGSSGSYMVALASQPTAAVTVSLSSGFGVTLDTDADTNGNQNTLTFSTANWNIPQTVEVNVGQDVNNTVTLSHSASGGDYSSVTASLSVNVQNICERMDALNSNGTICRLFSKGITSLNSGDFDGLSNLKDLYLNRNDLSSLPEDIFDGLSNLEALYLTRNDLSSLPEDTFDGLSKLQNLYLNQNDLSSLPEDIFDGLSNLEDLYLSQNNLSSLSEDIFDGLSNLEALHLTQNDLSSLPEDIFDGLSNLESLRLSRNDLSSLSENVFDGLSNLQSLPLGNNDLSSLPENIFDGLSDLQQLSLHNNELSSLPEEVFDGLSDLDRIYLSGNSLICLPRSLSLTVRLIDVDLPRCGNLLILTPSSLTVAEGGSGSYTVALSSEPTAAVMVTLSSGSGATVDTDADTDGNQKTLSFSTSNWNTPQTVAVSAEQDDDAVDGTLTLSHSASGGDYGLVTASLSVAVTDDDKAPALVLTPESPTVAEGGSGSYTVKLAGSPSAAVTLTISAGAGVTLDTDADTDGNQTTLSFSAANWNTPQTVEVSGEQDDDVVDEIIMLAHTASGGDYDSVTANLSVAVSDDDKAPALVLTPESLTVAEAGSGSYTVALAGSPSAAVTVTLTPGSGVTLDTDADTDGNQTTLSFSAANWNTPQTVEVSAEQDDDAVDDTVTLSHSASGGDYDSVSGDLVVTVSDDDKAPALVFSPENLTVAEGESGSYTVALAGSPTATVTVAVSVSTGSEVTVDTDATTNGNQNSLSFTTTNWYISQTVEVSAGLDNDTEDDTVTLSHSASGGDYGSVSGDFVVTVSDDETTNNNTNTTVALPSWITADGILEPLTLYVGGEDGSRDGSTAFSVDNDKAGDITWHFASSHPAVASVSEEPTNNPIVMVTPVREGKATITVRAASGNRISGPASFLVTVVTSPAEETAIRAAFSGQGRVVLGSVTDMIGKRFDSGTGGTGSFGSVCLNSAAGPDGESATSDESGSSGDNAIAGSYGDSSDHLIASDSWQGESWNTDLAATGLRGVPHVSHRDEDSMDKTFDDLLELFRGQPHSLHPADWAGECGSGAVGEESRPWTLWAGTDLQWARGGTDSSDFDGEWQLYYLGADRAFREQWLAGLSLSQVQGEVDYSFDEDATTGAGQLSSSLTAIYPYLHGQLSSNLELWAIGGIGFGDVENEREHVDGDADQGDLQMRLLSLGLRRSLSQAGSTIDLALTSDAGFLNLSAEGDGSLDGAEASIGRFRLGLELSRPFASGVEPFAQLHGRYDSGDGPTGAAGELVLGMRYGDERLKLELRGNHLTSAAELEQWGAKARLDYSPATNGTGLNLALNSQWGAAENGDSFLDGHTMKLPTPALVSAQGDGDSLPVEISGEIGYSLSMGQQWGILTPNLGYDHSDNGSSRSRVGLAYALSSALDRDMELRLDLARSERRQEDPDHSIELSTTLRF